MRVLILVLSLCLTSFAAHASVFSISDEIPPAEFLETLKSLNQRLMLWRGHEEFVTTDEQKSFNQTLLKALQNIPQFDDNSAIMDEALTLYDYLFRNKMEFPLTIFVGSEQHSFDLIEDSWMTLYRAAIKNHRSPYSDRIQQMQIMKLSGEYALGPSPECAKDLKERKKMN